MAADETAVIEAAMAKQRDLLKTGVPGTATIRKFTTTGKLVDFNPQVVLDLDVVLEDREPYPVELMTVASQTGVVQLVPGASIKVRVDPDDPQSLAIDWSWG
jgi:hypothetical protein